MSKAENYIRENTKLYSNISADRTMTSWLTPEQAIRAVEIAREEMLNEVCEWIEENIGEYCDGENIMFSATHIENIDVFDQERFIYDLRQAMKDEQG